MIRITCKKKYKLGKTYKSNAFKPKPSRPTRTKSAKWRKRVAEQPSIGRS